jgi:hypothetical protein
MRRRMENNVRVCDSLRNKKNEGEHWHSHVNDHMFSEVRMKSRLRFGKFKGRRGRKRATKKTQGARK